MATLTTLVQFNFTDGASPDGTLAKDAAGNLFGLTGGGGANSSGTIFELPFIGGSYATTPTTLFSFDSTEAATSLYPSPVSDAAGDLFDTTGTGGANGLGSVFELAKIGGTYATALTTLVDFNNSNGAAPTGGLYIDAAADLFGVTAQGGTNGLGTVFEIAKTAGGYAPLSTLATFDNSNGSSPRVALIADAAGDLFGTTATGGTGFHGTVFEIPKTAGSFGPLMTLANFDGVTLDNSVGNGPYSGLTIDAAGNLYGMTEEGGANAGIVAVYEIAKTAGGYANTPTILASFRLPSDHPANGGLLSDAAGNLFATAGGGSTGQGSVTEIANSGTGHAMSPTTLASFGGASGAFPDGGLIEAGGNLFGTTSAAGNPGGWGTVFELSDTGFVTCYAAGTRIATPDGERAVEALKAGDLVRTASGAMRPIVWIGHRRVDCRRHQDPRRVWPVRISAGAFAPNLPQRDLLVSPQHAIYAEGALIPARYLVNETSVAVEPAAVVDYYHVELPSHDLLLAEGLPAESYLDTGDRGNFDNGRGAMRLHPDFAAWSWDARACAELKVVGPEVQAVKAKLARRASLLASKQTVHGSPAAA